MTEKRKEEIRSCAEVLAGDRSYSLGSNSRRYAGDILIECLGEIERLQNIVWELNRFAALKDLSEEKARREAQLDAYIAAFEK